MYDHKKKELYCSFFFYNYSIYVGTESDFLDKAFI